MNKIYATLSLVLALGVASSVGVMVGKKHPSQTKRECIVLDMQCQPSGLCMTAETHFCEQYDLVKNRLEYGYKGIDLDLNMWDAKAYEAASKSN